MKVKFLGVPGEKHDSIDMYGQTFPVGKSVTVNDKFAKMKLKNHPHFETSEDEVSDAKVVSHTSHVTHK